MSYGAIAGYGAELNGVSGGNPLFVDIDNGDARLQAGSPLIGEGEGGGDIGAWPYSSGGGGSSGRAFSTTIGGRGVTFGGRGVEVR